MTAQKPLGMDMRFVPATNYDPSWLRLEFDGVLPEVVDLMAELNRVTDGGQFLLLWEHKTLLFPCDPDRKRASVALHYLLPALRAAGIAVIDNWPKKSWCICRDRFSKSGQGKDHPYNCDTP